VQSDFVSPWGNINVVLSLRDSSFPLVQCTRLEVGEPFRGVDRFDVVDACFKSEDTLEEVYDLVETHLEGSPDVFVHKDFPSLDFNNIVSSNPLDHSHVSPKCSQPSIFPEHSLDAPIDNPKICDSKVHLGHAGNMFNMFGGNVDNFLSLGYFCGYDASRDLYCIFPVDKPRKVRWNTFFAFSFDFSMALTLLKRALTFFVVIIFKLSYFMLGNSMLRSLKALACFNGVCFHEPSLHIMMEWLMLHVSRLLRGRIA